jgi:HTH-type transcriptional regulator/antitoxin HigA
MERNDMEKALAEAFPPGEYLASELEERGWSQTDFAAIIERPVQFVSEIVSGKKEITRESAAQIGAALGTSAEVWLNLQNSFLLWKQSQNEATRDQLNNVRRRARMNELAPVELLRKRGLLRGNTLDELESDLRQLLGIESMADEPTFVVAARRANKDVPLTSLQRAWIASCLRRARELDVPDYDPGELAQLAKRLPQALKTPDDFSSLPDSLGAVGVRLVYVESFPGSKMTGVTILLDDNPSKPVIALSGRGKRLDFVLFTLLHEIAHLLRGDVRPGKYRIDDEDIHTAGDETKADNLAASWIVPGGLPVPPKPVKQQWVDEEAERFNVSPLVIVGQLQRHQHLDWRTQLVKGAPTVTGTMATWATRS